MVGIRDEVPIGHHSTSERGVRPPPVAVGLTVGEALTQSGQYGPQEGIDERLGIGPDCAGDRQPAIDQHRGAHALGMVGRQPGHDVRAERVSDYDRLLELESI